MVCAPLIIANGGPPESPWHLPLLSVWLGRRRFVFGPPKVAHDVEVRAGGGNWTPAEPPPPCAVAPRPTICTVTPIGAIAASKLIGEGTGGFISGTPFAFRTGASL